MQRLFEDLDTEEFPDVSAARIDITAKYRGSNLNFKELLLRLSEDMEEQTRLLGDKDRELFEDILANTISKKIRARIQSSQRMVEQMNTLMGAMQTSSGLAPQLKMEKTSGGDRGSAGYRRTGRSVAEGCRDHAGGGS